MNNPPEVKRRPAPVISGADRRAVQLQQVRRQGWEAAASEVDRSTARFTAGTEAVTLPT